MVGKVVGKFFGRSSFFPPPSERPISENHNLQSVVTAWVFWGARTYGTNYGEHYWRFLQISSQDGHWSEHSAHNIAKSGLATWSVLLNFDWISEIGPFHRPKNPNFACRHHPSLPSHSFYSSCIQINVAARLGRSEQWLRRSGGDKIVPLAKSRFLGCPNLQVYMVLLPHVFCWKCPFSTFLPNLLFTPCRPYPVYSSCFQSRGVSLRSLARGRPRNAIVAELGQNEWKALVLNTERQGFNLH